MSVQSTVFEEWLQKAQQGDESARNRLLASCRSFVAVIARCQMNRRLQSKVDPSDIVQQSLVDAHLGLGKFEGRTTQEWLAWLKQIVQHNILDMDKHYRGTARRDMQRERGIGNVDSTASHSGWLPIDPQPSPSHLAALAERKLRLAAALENLPEDYRLVIILRNLERLSFEAISEQMNRSRGACQMLWMRAVEQLRSRFQDESVF